MHGSRMNKKLALLSLATRTPDRRRTYRLKTRVRVDFCPLLALKEGFKVGPIKRSIALDLSQSGLFLAEGGYLKVGTTIHLTLRLPDISANPINCYARVVRRELAPRLGYGLHFIQLRVPDARRLNQYVKLIKSRSLR